MAPRVVGILQPGYMPWQGFFQQMLYSDVFVLYDDVQYDKHGWRNRNRVKGPRGPVWLTVPVVTKGLNQPLINQVRIDASQGNWAKKHLGTIRQNYAKAPHFQPYFSQLEELLLGRTWDLLWALDLELIRLMAGWLGLGAELKLSSDLGVENPDATGRLIEIIKQVGGQVFFEGAAGRDYLDQEAFARQDIQLVFQKFEPRPHPQQYQGFEPYLSALDLVLNCGPDSRGYLEAAQPPF